MRLTVLALGFLFSNFSYAGVYKCTDLNGNTGYQAKPCDVGKKTVQINFKTGEAIDKKLELEQKALETEKQKLAEMTELERQKKQEQLLIDAKAEIEKNKALIKNNPKKFSVYSIPPYDPENLNDLVKKYKSRLPEIESLRRAAALKALASKDCTRVEAVELNVKSSLDSLVFLVDCSSGQGIYFDESELK